MSQQACFWFTHHIARPVTDMYAYQAPKIVKLEDWRQAEWIQSADLCAA